ncbi:MAG: histidinol dehydrogenase [Clostridiales bacterium]|nr:histidinol dehydrogenase [Clostridiales bacterium]
MIKVIDGKGKSIDSIMDMIDRPSQLEFAEGRESVERILKNVRELGDRAVFKFTKKFEQVEYNNKDEMFASKEEIKEAYNLVPTSLLNIMKKAKSNIEKYHKKQLKNSWMSFENNGIILGQLITPISRVGVYVPGGRASYPSSVLMNVIPAKIAGVSDIIMVTPPRADGSIDPNILAAAYIAGVDTVIKIGGAQAIAALAYGTESIKKVDKIVGPGNIYVTLAKKEVYGLVDIDMIAGPSEILIIADDTANPKFIAADLLSQAEHDPMASVILTTDSDDLIEGVKKELKLQTKDISTKDTIEASLAGFGYLILVDDLKMATQVSNSIAPEHLEIMTDYPERELKLIKNAGSIFLGDYSPEPLGDYMAGPNHVLPTSGTAKFYSALGVDAFIKRSSIIQYTKKALSKDYKDIAEFARAEGFEAHARSVEVRF